MQIFVDDPLFDITIVSTYNYQFKNANNILLPSISKKKSRLEYYCHELSQSSNILYKKIGDFFIYMYKISHEIDNFFIDRKTIKLTLKKVQPDIIFLQTLLYPNYLILSIRTHAPMVITFWNGDITWWAQWTGIERLLKKWIVSYGVNIADVITTNSQFTHDKIYSLYNRNKNVNVIPYPGVDLDIFLPKNKQLSRIRLGIPVNNKLILWPRGTGYYLNFDTLVSISKELLTLYPDVLIIVLTPSPEDEKYKSILSSMGILDSFIFKEKISFEDMPYYYSASDVMISISSNDSLPNTMLEAMACGCPVIMSDIPQIWPWISDGENGYLCPINSSDILLNKLKQIFENKNNVNEFFSLNNINIIKHRVDSKKMCGLIKAVVIATANDIYLKNKYKRV